MKLLKYAIATFLVCGAVVLSIWLIELIPVNHFGYAISMNFLFMAIYTIIFDKIFSQPFSSKYFKSLSFERKGNIYIWFGIRYYKNLLKTIGWEKIIRNDQSIKNNLASLDNYERWTKGSELIHLFSAITIFGFILFIVLHYSINDILWLFTFNILVNVYPVMLQRYNRPRIIKLINYRKRRSGMSSSS
jgi:hypothetical protein